MSFTYLLNPNNYTVYANKASIGELELSNTRSYTCYLTYFDGSVYQQLANNVIVKTTLIGDFVFIEIPEFSVTIPTGVLALFLSESLNEAEITFPFNFKYDSIGYAYTDPPGTTIKNPLEVKTFTINNSPIQLNKVDGTGFTSGLNKFYSSVQCFVRVL